MTGDTMGFKCPRCAHDRWLADGTYWNLWNCQWCEAICTIRDGVMDVYVHADLPTGSEDAKAEAALRKRQKMIYPDYSSPDLA